MNPYQDALNNLKEKLLSSSKERLLCISTTANKNNPSIYFGSFRETQTTLAGNIIVRDISLVEKIIEIFDGVVSYFLIDSEVKNEVLDLEAYCTARIKKSKYLVYKPNDFTVHALDMLIATRCGSIRGQNVLIVGFGNIGAKIALCLSERGANVFAYERNQEKLTLAVNGLNVIKRSTSDIHPLSDVSGGEEKIDILIGATPGTPALDQNIVDKVKSDGMIIDVGNGTLTPDGIGRAHEKKITIHSLSSLSGYIGMIENWIFQRNLLAHPAKKEYHGIVLILPGTLGAFGEILVDDVKNPQKVIGICNGQGDLLSREDAAVYFQTLEKNSVHKDLLAKLHQLYF